MRALALLLLAATASAASLPWERNQIHPVVANMPRSAESSIAAVARYITDRVHDPVERVRALHDWVADRIAYDTEALERDAIPWEDGDAEWVFAHRRGVCAGYAALLAKLGWSAGVAIGVAHSFRLNHAYNQVWMGTEIVDLDATWDAGYVWDGEFFKSYSTQYLFVTDHLGHPPSWAKLAAGGISEPPVVVESWESWRRRAEAREIDWKQIGL